MAYYFPPFIVRMTLIYPFILRMSKPFNAMLRAK
nr:MAG TPA: hypothetical protein [Caudoviricetes sp.]